MGDQATQLTMLGAPPAPNPELSQYDTPRYLAERMARFAGVKAEMKVLEPSAGTGALARVASAMGASVQCVEIDPGRAAFLRADGFGVHEGDFLTAHNDPCWHLRADLALMNPPYEDGQDLGHVLQALTFAPRVVAMLPLGNLDGVDRYDRLWRKHTLSRLAVLVRRFKAPGSEHGGQRPFGVFEILPGKQDVQQTIEWWP